MNNNKTLIDYISGGMDISFILWLIICAVLGVLFSLLIHSTNRHKITSKGPQKFSFLYLVKDNWKRVLLDVGLIIITLRFSSDILGMEPKGSTAFLIGVFHDKLAEFLKNKGIAIGRSI